MSWSRNLTWKSAACFYRYYSVKKCLVSLKSWEVLQHDLFQKAFPWEVWSTSCFLERLIGPCPPRSKSDWTLLSALLKGHFSRMRSTNPYPLMPISGQSSCVHASLRCWVIPLQCDIICTGEHSGSGGTVGLVCNYLGVHLNNKLDWSHNTDVLNKKGQSHFNLLRRLRAFGVCRTLLRAFYDTVVASAILCAVVCWGCGSSEGDMKRLNEEC